MGGASITVLPDSGATFKRYGLDKRVKIRKSSCQIKPYGSATDSNLIPVLGNFEALTESKSKMKVIKWQLIKGDTHTVAKSREKNATFNKAKYEFSKERVCSILPGWFGFNQ